jgi:hypothetical protein
LQDDFSLNHTLSLYLVDTIEKLDPAAETWPLDVLSLVEAILENPRPVLMAQQDRLKTETMDRLKAEHVEYEERIRQLDEIEWPKPNREFTYETWNAFAARHPWVGTENIAPKSVARELSERFCSFHDYVRDYGLQRAEGVLLRYLSDAYKTAQQTVPARFRTPALDDVIASLGAILRIVDSSLLDEWEALLDPAGAEARAATSRAAAEATARGLSRRDITADPRAFTARVRAELHRLLGALARKDFLEALAALRPVAANADADGDAPAWTTERLSTELAPYFAQHGAIVTTPLARAPRNTELRETEPRLWDAQQRLVDPEGDDDFAIFARVDLRDREAAIDDAPIIELVRIGV